MQGLFIGGKFSFTDLNGNNIADDPAEKWSMDSG